MTSPLRKSARRTLGSRHPAQLVAIAFATVIAIGTGLLLLPFSSDAPGPTGFINALFTSTSAVCVTGLAVVDTPEHWTRFGQAVILLLIQVGGFGIITLASLIAVVVSRRVGLRGRLLAQAESNAVQGGDVRRVLVGVAVTSAVVEGLATVILGLRFLLTYDEPVLRAAWLGLFHAVSAFNNAGFALFSDNLERFVTDPVVSLTVSFAVIVGGIGFPVIIEIFRSRRAEHHRWTVHTRLTLAMTAALLLIGTVAILLLEWSNPATLGGLDVEGKALAAFFQGVNPRTAGFNTLPYGEMRETSWLVTDVLMFIGGGSASAAGGIKVTTFALLGFVIWAEVRGDPDVNLFGRRSPAGTQRQALSIALLAVGAVVGATLVLLASSGLTLSQTLFEAISAFGTVGLSTGVTAGFSILGHLTLIALMFIGRIGPITVFAALVLRERERLYRFPEERPIIG